MDFDRARNQMISQQLRAWDVLDERVLEVMGTLPRELFVPPQWQALAYADTEIPLGRGKQLAPPKIQGRALQALLPQPEEAVLEIGSGTGYLTACLASLASRVTGVEYHEALAAAARRNLSSLGIDNAAVLAGDGPSMDFDQRFEVVCVNGSLPDWNGRFQQLLTVGGRLFLVVGRPPVMRACRVTRTGEDQWRTETVFETCLPALENTRPPVEFDF